jgi:Pyruvate/2-oxoacid:ferredoxin oxidoreductase gamma subunit
MKTMVGLIIAILIIFGLNLFWPSSDPDVSLNDNTIQKAETTEVALDSDGQSVTPELNTPSDDEKTELMKKAYSELEQERKNLKRNIARLKHEMWGLRFPPDKAKQISETVLSAARLIKNPPMLGAFSSVQQIQDEINKVTFAQNSLEQVNVMIQEKKKSSKESG